MFAFFGLHVTPPPVRFLSLASTGITANDWTVVTALNMLNHLDLHGNRLWGTVPPAVSALTALSYLDMSGNLISGTVPSTLAAIPGLRCVNPDV